MPNDLPVPNSRQSALSASPSTEATSDENLPPSLPWSVTERLLAQRKSLEGESGFFLDIIHVAYSYFASLDN
jgi:hypothetical protein